MKKLVIVLAVIVCLLAVDQIYNAGFAAGRDALDPVPRPASGTILAGEEHSGSEITVTADDTDDYVVSLKDFRGTQYVAFYVRAGETVTVGVPMRKLYVYFASGDEWYGYGQGKMFGDHTSYGLDDEATDFAQGAWEYRLYPVSDGNFSETPSNENEFFE